MSEENVNQKVTDAMKEDAPFGYCPECGVRGVQREKRINGDDKCAAGHTYPSAKAFDKKPAIMTEYSCTSNATQPCKSCGRDNAVREFGLMCESCQRESKFTIGSAELQRHLTKAQEQDLRQAERLQAENERSRAAWKKDQEENQARHRAFVQEEQARNNELSDERALRIHELDKAVMLERTRKDQLHRLYSMLLQQALANNYIAAPTYCETAMNEAKRAQAYFEEKHNA